MISGLEKPPIATNANVIQQYDVMALNYGLKMDFYEGGVDMSGDTSGNFANAKVPANYDPRMAQVITDYLNNAYASNADLLMYYSLASAYTPSGTWGLTENTGYLTGPKFTAFNAFTQGPMPALSVGTKLSGTSLTTVAGGSYLSDIYESTGLGGDAQAWGSQTYDYLVNADAAQYTMNITAGAGTSVNVTVLVDGKSVGTLTFAGTGSQTAYAATTTLSLGTLTTGLHNIRLQLDSGGFGIHSLNITGKALNAIMPTPSALVVSPMSYSQLKLTWLNISGETGYSVERSSNGINNWKQVVATTANVTTFTNTGLSPATTYYYRVRAILGGGKYSAYSNVAIATTAIQMVTVQATSGGMTTSNTTPSGTVSKLTWSPVPQTRTYMVQQQAANGNWMTVATASAGATTYKYKSTGHAMQQVVALSTVGMQLASSSVVKLA